MNMIKLYAYLVDNLGDDLMVDILLKRYPDCRFFSDVPVSLNNALLDNKNFICTEALYHKYGRINHLLSIVTFGRSDKFYFPKMFQKYEKNCGAAILIGGSLFMQFPSQDTQKRIENEEKYITVSPKYLIGANFGPYQTEDFLLAFSKHFQTYAGITFRDRYSFDLFPDCDHISYAPDVVLNLDIAPYVSEKQTRNVIISVVDFSRNSRIAEYADAYDQYIARCCAEVIRRGDTPVLMSFCKKEGDEDAIARILEQVDPTMRPHVRQYFYTGNIPDALSLIASAKYVIATRFHAMILAIRFNKPFFSIAYNPKIINVLDDLCSNAWIHPEQLKTSDPSQQMDAFSAPIDAALYIKEAEKQFAQFEKSYLYANHSM